MITAVCDSSVSFWFTNNALEKRLLIRGSQGRIAWLRFSSAVVVFYSLAVLVCKVLLMTSSFSLQHCPFTTLVHCIQKRYHLLKLIVQHNVYGFLNDVSFQEPSSRV